MTVERAWEFQWLRTSPVGPTCPTCDRIHGSDAVVAVGKFRPGGPIGYRAVTGGPLRSTREAAHADYCNSEG